MLGRSLFVLPANGPQQLFIALLPQVSSPFCFDFKVFSQQSLELVFATKASAGSCYILPSDRKTMRSTEHNFMHSLSSVKRGVGTGKEGREEEEALRREWAALSAGRPVGTRKNGRKKEPSFALPPISADVACGLCSFVRRWNSGRSPLPPSSAVPRRRRQSVGGERRTEMGREGRLRRCARGRGRRRRRRRAHKGLGGRHSGAARRQHFGTNSYYQVN